MTSPSPELAFPASSDWPASADRAAAEPLPSVRGPVQADLVYALTTEQRPYFYMYEPPPGKERLFGEYGPCPVQIEDGRDAAPFALALHGFELQRHTSTLHDAYDDAEVRAVYYPEMERLVQAATGAPRVLVFDHNVRSGPKFKAGRRGVQEPVRRVHNDYTAESALRRLTQLLPDEAATLQARRFAFINVWRPLFGPILDTPLAVCDARSIEPRDLVKIDLIYPDRIGENYNFAYSKRHRWYYFSQMLDSEVLLLQCFDSIDDGRPRFTAHTAFDDPRAPRNARPRESIEIRTIAFY